MLVLKYLQWSLSKLRNLHFKCGLFYPGHLPFEVDIFLIGEMIEQIVEGDGRGSTLLISESEVDPLVDMRGDVVAFEGCSHLQEKLLRVLRPFGKHHIVDQLSLGGRAHLQLFAVYEKVAVGRVKLRN